MNYPSRKYPRLKNFDYSAGGVFCVTICTKEKAKLFGYVDVASAAMHLSELGALVQAQIDRIPQAYPGTILWNRVVMPNHLHILLQIPPEAPVSLFSVVRGTKSLVTRTIGYSIWQASFYEHVVRNEADALRFWKYIDENPAKWALDPYYE